MGPNNIKVGDTIDGNEIIEIKGLVNGKPTWASTFVCRQDRKGHWDYRKGNKIDAG